MVIRPMSFSFGQSVRINSASERHSSGRQPLFLDCLAEKTVLRLLTARVDFHEHVEGILALGKATRGVQFLRQLDAVDTLDHPEVRNLADELIALSALQVSDQMPLDILGEDFRLVHQFLHIVLSKVAMTVVVEFLDVLGRLLLAHSYDTGLSGQSML